MKVTKVSKDIENGLLVFTVSQHTWAISEPDKNGLRAIQHNEKDEGKGILLGSVIPIALGYMTQSSDIEVGRNLGIEFPDRPDWKCILISTPVTAIMIKEKVAAK